MLYPIIQADCLSKRYIIGHEANERYTALRDIIAQRTKSFLRGSFRQRRSTDKEEFWALKDVSFTIKRGDRLGIIGRNGAGKSTLLKILSRITEPSQGSVRIRGRVASLLEVGTGFHPELTGRENIFLNGAILGMTRAEIRKKFHEIVTFAEVEKFLDTPVKRYSSGMYVRLAFAVAAHMEPEILLVDEVLAVGDVQFQKKCLGKMEDVSKSEGRTILFVSHNLIALNNLCSSAIMLDKGNLVMQGPTSSVINKYLESNKESSTNWVDDGYFDSHVNEHLRIQSISLYDTDEPQNKEFSLDSNLSLAIEAVVLTRSELLFDLHLFNSDGSAVFDVCSPVRVFEQSRIRAVCQIPRNLLNDDFYTLSVSGVLDHTIELFRLHNIIMFNVVETHREIKWHGKWPGVIRPSLHWEFSNGYTHEI